MSLRYSPVGTFLETSRTRKQSVLGLPPAEQVIVVAFEDVMVVFATKDVSG
jgi:hypothetical protein